MRGKIRSVGLSDVGRVREHNEDTIGVDADIGLFVLADGMGGYNAGEVASGIAVKTVMSLVKEAVEHQDMSSADPETGMQRPSIVLRDSIARANKIIYQTAKTQPQCEGMGTTIVACLFFDNKVAIAHVGDSRLYRLRSTRFEQMTMDHSLLQELVDRGFYSQAEAQRALTPLLQRSPVAADVRRLKLLGRAEIRASLHRLLPRGLWLTLLGRDGRST